MTSNSKTLLAVIGPGILVAATGIGAGDLATSAFTGRALGLTVLWAVVLGAFFKFVLNEGLARWQLATGRTLVEGCCDRFGKAGNGLEDLVGRQVAVVTRNVSEKLMKPRTDINIESHPDLRTALFDLLSGHEDALVFPKTVLMNMARQIGVEDRIKIVGKPLKEIKRAIRIQKNQPELAAILNTAVESFVGTPEYQRIYVKWYGKPKPYWTVVGIFWTMGGLLVATLIGMGWWRYYSVVQLNQALKNSEERFKDFAESASDWFWEMDGGLRFTYMSSRNEEKAGFMKRL